MTARSATVKAAYLTFAPLLAQQNHSPNVQSVTHSLVAAHPKRPDSSEKPPESLVVFMAPIYHAWLGRVDLSCMNFVRSRRVFEQETNDEA